MDRWQATRTHEELAQHAEWLRGLARALVGNAAVADDLAQDAWLAFGGRALDEGSTRPFLARVVRRLAGKWRRGESRRIARERDAGRDEHVPTPDESLERLETQEMLVRALKGLPEPYRGTLMLRYFDGLDAAEIARRTGVPAGTVRSRITRGLEELRTRLDAHARGDRRSWMLALLPIANARHVAAGVGATSVGVIGAMSAKWIIASAALVLAALFVWMIETSSVRPSGATDVSIGASANDVAQGAQPVASDGGAAQRVAIPSERDAAPQKPLTISARFVDFGRAPIAGVALDVPDLASTPRAVSDADGRVDLLLDATSSPQETFKLRAICEGWATKTIDAPSDHGATLWLGEVELERAGSIVGRVVDADHFGVAGARVYAENILLVGGQTMRQGPMRRTIESGFGAVTDRSGAFRLNGVPEGYWWLWTFDVGHAWSRKDFVGVAREHPTEVELQLGELASSNMITGRVVDPNGKLIADAQVSILDGAGLSEVEPHCTSRADGSFEAFVWSAARYTLEVADAGGRWTPVRMNGIAAGGADVVVAFALTPAAQVHVVDSNGQAICEARVIVLGADRKRSNTTDLKSNALGVANLPRSDGAFSLSVAAGGFKTVELGPFEPRDGDNITVELERGPGLRGRVTSVGRGIEGARVTLRRAVFNRPYLEERSRWSEDAPVTDPDSLPIAGDTSTSADGSFALAPPPSEDRWSLIVEALGFATATLQPLDLHPDSDVDTLDIALVVGGALEGVVRSKSASANGAWTVLARSEVGVERTCLVELNGGYRIEHLSPGTWRVRAYRRDDGKDWQGVQWLTPSQAPDLEVSVSDGVVAHLDITVPDRTANLLEGELVVREYPLGLWNANVGVLKSSMEVSELGRLLNVDGRFRARFHSACKARITLKSNDPWWQHAEIVDTVEIDQPLVTWRCELALAHVSGHSATLRDVDVDGVCDESSTRRVSTRFHVDVDGRFDAQVPVGLVKFQCHAEPNAPAGAALLTLNVAEGADEHIELP